MRWWKWLGLAALLGVAATGVKLERSRRHWRAYDADEVRAKLHERLAGASGPAREP